MAETTLEFAIAAPQGRFGIDLELPRQVHARKQKIAHFVFETIGGEARDQVAVDYIMGHVDTSMANAYRERISDERLSAVVEHVRKWLFPKTKPAKGRKAGRASARPAR